MKTYFTIEVAYQDMNGELIRRIPLAIPMEEWNTAYDKKIGTIIHRLEEELGCTLDFTGGDFEENTIDGDIVRGFEVGFITDEWTKKVDELAALVIQSLEPENLLGDNPILSFSRLPQSGFDAESATTVSQQIDTRLIELSYQYFRGNKEIDVVMYLELGKDETLKLGAPTSAWDTPRVLSGGKLLSIQQRRITETFDRSEPTCTVELMTITSDCWRPVELHLTAGWWCFFSEVNRDYQLVVDEIAYEESKTRFVPMHIVNKDQYKQKAVFFDYPIVEKSIVIPVIR
jgi:hypothetical protein